MKKKLLTLLGILILSSTLGIASAKTVVSSDLSSAIKLYKAGNYTGCYSKLDTVIKKDPANALAYYYKAMASSQLGKKDEAINNYGKAITLAAPNSNLSRYATKGKRCLETPDKCQESMFESSLDEFIQNKKGPSVSDEVRSDYERLKIENMMREINRSDDIDPQKFKEYKDFSSMNPDMPSNDEIVAALRTLQKAGLGNVLNNGYTSDISLLTGTSGQNPMLNMMGTSSLSPQMIQALFTNNMSLGF